MKTLSRLTTRRVRQRPRKQSEICIDRRAFLRMPISERRKIMAAQAEKLITHYTTDPDVKHWLAFTDPIHD